MKFFLRTRSITIVAALAVASGTAGLASLTALSGPTRPGRPAVDHRRGRRGCRRHPGLFDALSGASAPNSATTHFFTPLHANSANGNTTIQSFDAFPAGGSTVNPGCITTLTGGPSFDRPNSTTNGIAALNAAISGSGWENTSASCTNALVNVTGQINFARAARGPKTTGLHPHLRPLRPGRGGLPLLRPRDRQPGHADHGPAEGPLLGDDHHHRQ